MEKEEPWHKVPLKAFPQAAQAAIGRIGGRVRNKAQLAPQKWMGRRRSGCLNVGEDNDRSPPSFRALPTGC